MTRSTCMTRRTDNSTTTADRLSESELIARLKAGDDAAYETLVHEHMGRMLAVARRFLRSEDGAADAVQEAFLSAFKSIDRFEGGSTLGTWLHRIVVNACLMKMRSSTRRPSVSIDDLFPRFDGSGHHVEPVSPWTEQPPSQLDRAEMRELVRSCIDRLPVDYRTILLLRDIEELDTDEAARQLGVTRGTVKTRLHRARQALRTLLDPHVRAGSIAVAD